LREYEATFKEGLAKGLRSDESNPINSEALIECFNAKPAERGLVPFEPLTCPISGLTIDWPFPQLFIGPYARLLATRTKLYSLDAEWAETEELTFTSGSILDMADFGTYVLLANDKTLIEVDADGSYSAFTSSSSMPGVATICDFKGQAIGGDVLTTWHGCGHNFVVWSDIGSINFVPTRRNEAGFRPMPWQGYVKRVMRLGDVVMVYGDNGMASLVPVTKPAPTFKFDEVMDLGIPHKGAVGGDKNVHAFVDQKGWLWRALPGKLERLGYQEYMKTMTLANIMISYDPSEKEFFISDGVKGFLLTRHGLCEIHQLVTSCASLDGNSIGVYDDTEDTEFRGETDTVDLGLRALKTISVLELQADYAAASWNREGTFKDLPWVRINDAGFATVQATAVEFRLRAKSNSYANANLDYIKARFKLVDKRAIRGVYVTSSPS